MEKRVSINLRLKEDLYRAVKRIADEEDRTITAQIARWLREGIERYDEGHAGREEGDR